MKKAGVLLCSLILLAVITGCSVTPATTMREPAIGTVATTGIGDAMYVYKKTPQVFVDYMNAKSTNQTNGFQQEIVYSGLAKSELKILYREYVNDMARASFFQDAVYEYSPPASTTIKFKGAVLEVLDASNTEIKYKVISGFTGEEYLQGKSK